MGELTIRRTRGGTPIDRYRPVSKTEKTAQTAESSKVTKPSGDTVSENLRRLMNKITQAADHARESSRTLQVGEAALREVQDALSRMGNLARQAVGGDSSDRAALQAELDHLRESIGRMIDSAVVSGVPLFLDEDAAVGAQTVALLYEVLGELSPSQAGAEALPNWLTQAITQETPTPEELLDALGLDQTATGADILAALAQCSLDEDPAAGYLAALYLGTIISGGSLSGSIDPQEAMDGLYQLLEQISQGLSPDEAVNLLTDGLFTSFEDFEAQFIGGTAPELQNFLTDLLLSEQENPVLEAPSLLPLLAGLEDLNFQLMMDLLDMAQGGLGGDMASAPQADAAAAQADTAAAAQAETVAEGVSVQTFGSVQVMGEDLSGVSFDPASGVLTVDGSADVTIQGTGPVRQAIHVIGTGDVTLRDVRVSTLSLQTDGVRVLTAGTSTVEELHLEHGVSPVLDGGGLLRLASLRAEGANTLRLAGGAVVVESDEADGQPGTLTIPVVLEGPASLAARAQVRDLSGQPTEPLDLVWKTLLPNWNSLNAVTVDGKQARMALFNGQHPDLARLWLAKGDHTAHGYPMHALVLQGRDSAGRPQTRYTYLRWSRQMGSFQEGTMYPNPFTVTGGEPDKDWVYDEDSHTLRILSNQVTAISGGTGTGADQLPFSGRIALADGIGPLELTLGGVTCQVTSGRAFDLGKENRVTLLLQNGADNRFQSGAGCAGISLGEGTSLCVDCEDAPQGDAGTLIATGGEGGAGIGRDSDSGRDQTSYILICGGVITAAGGDGGAGIGAGKRSSMGPVTIIGGTIEATGGEGGGAGIGGAFGAPVGDISIRGGSITAIASRHAAAIGAGVQGESGDIRITGKARIVQALGGDPGADIGACLLGGCGTVQVSGSVDMGKAKVRRQSGVPLRMGKDTVTLPQFPLSPDTLQLGGLSVATLASAQAARDIIEADRRQVAQIQSAYGALYGRLERSLGGRHGGLRFARMGQVRDTAAAGALLKDMRQSILLQSAQAMYAHYKRDSKDTQQLLR